MEDHILSPRESVLHDDKKPITKLSVLKELLVATASMYMFGMLERLGFISNVYFMSRSGDSVLVAALGLANTWIWIIGLGVITSFTCGMTTLVAQAYGANMPKLCSAYFHKGIVINILLYGFYLSTLFFFKPLLRTLGYDKDLIEVTHSYLAYMLPSVLGSMIFGTLKFYAQGHKIFNAPVYIQISFTIIECILSYLIIIVFNLGFFGLSLSRGFSEFGRALALFVYMKKSKVFEDTLHWFDSSSMHGFWTQLKFQLNSGMVVYLDMVTFAVSQLFIAGYDVNEYAASYSAMAVISFFITGVVSVIQPATSYLGNAVGEGNVVKTEMYWDVSNKVILILSVILSLIMIIFSSSLARFYLEDPDISSLAQKILVLYGSLMTIDAWQMYLSSIARVFGKEHSAFIAMVIFDLVIGESLAVFIGLICKYGALGVWGGLMTGVVINTYAQYKILNKVNVRKYIYETQQRLKQEGEDKKEEKEIEMKDF